ncbi:hypothetical protein [Carbonactinospora thermoautotrophica]|uniref:hypothetical protein n=1 Tax=Carbonactinospora thermoautotrophica TaxID=1469144 RepID=UPI00226FEC42|nr:hypothetical protein [Carbonactinospora thermoautotrophica]
MLAVVWHGPRRISVDDVPHPAIAEPPGAGIQVPHAGIRGSGRHLYDHGATALPKPGDVPGAEATDVVEETGLAHAGDPALASCDIQRGHRSRRERGWYSCKTNRDGRKGASLFGYPHRYGGAAGGQAERSRAPQAHSGPIRINRQAIPDHAAGSLAEAPPTAWQAVESAQPSGTLAVRGLGSIGQRRCLIARYRGAERVIDAEGSPADRVLQPGRLQQLVALYQALSSGRRGGTVSGRDGGWTPKFPLGAAYLVTTEAPVPRATEPYPAFRGKKPGRLTSVRAVSARTGALLGRPDSAGCQSSQERQGGTVRIPRLPRDQEFERLTGVRGHAACPGHRRPAGDRPDVDDATGVKQPCASW